ncbi:MAG: CoA transferase [Oryzomonas sp.]|uniref:CoA transferase n=1 Tax=Oryzomonas sp. TaxID=2855186 RepID=UPI00283B9736|nr:CoA transferase [Oryzomonas sp.]MDR3580117.1 CoA transferase [Oryzomonas sp.]
MTILNGIKIVNLSVNLPGPAAAQRLSRMGADVVKVEPPAGDPMETYCADWYRAMAFGHTVIKLDLKLQEGKRVLLDLLDDADVLITATRPSAMHRLGLDWSTLQQQFPKLCQVAIVGYPAPRDNEAGHDLTYQASMRLIDPPQMPRTLLSDMAGAERTISAALGLLYNRERSGAGGHEIVALSEAVAAFAEPLQFGCTLPGASLGGGIPEYNIYKTMDGWVAVAALETHFKNRLEDALHVGTPEEYRDAFAGQSSAYWQEWGKQLDVPIETVR